MNLRELVDTVDIPDTRVAEDAWDRAHARLRRRRAVTAAGVGSAVAIVLVGVSAITPQSGQRPPTPLTGSPDPTPTSSDAEAHLPVTIIRPDWANLGTAPALTPPADAPALSSDPVAHAALVMGDPEDQAAAYVLGDDGDWRRLDVPGLVPMSDGFYTSSIVVPTALDPDATRMAIPQPQALVVVDLTSGQARRYGVKGFLHHAAWADDTHVLVATEGAAASTLVDLANGATEKTELDPATRLLADGSTLTWPRGDSAFLWNGTATQSVVNNGGVQPEVPLLQGGLGVVLNSGGSMHDPPPAYPPQELTSTAGIAAVDLASGDPVGYIQMSEPLASKGTFSSLLGWRGNDPVLALVSDELSSIRGFVATWDVEAGTLEPIATLPSWDLAWGVGP